MYVKFSMCIVINGWQFMYHIAVAVPILFHR